MKYPEYIGEIIRRFEACGESAYIVGGSLRDMMLGIAPHDYDIATSALPKRTVEIFSDKHVIETGLKHGTVTVVFDGEPVEITTFRIDGSYTDMRHPDSVSFTDDITLDLSRRDFTINAMAYSPSRGLVDPFFGRADIEKRLICAVGDPVKRFSEDALRIMRAYRFSAQLGFSIDEGTLDAAMKMAEGLALIARERIANEFFKLITSGDPYRSLVMMQRNGALKYVLGEYEPSDEILSQLCKMPAMVPARMGLLLSRADEDTAREILRSLRASGKQTTGALAVARGACLKTASPADARRLFALVGIYAEQAALASELLEISPSGAYEMTKRQADTPTSIRDLKVNGKDMAKLGASGRLIGDTLSALLSMVVDDPTLNDREKLLALAEETINKSKGN